MAATSSPPFRNKVKVNHFLPINNQSRSINHLFWNKLVWRWKWNNSSYIRKVKKIPKKTKKHFLGIKYENYVEFLVWHFRYMEGEGLCSHQPPGGFRCFGFTPLQYFPSDPLLHLMLTLASEHQLHLPGDLEPCDVQVKLDDIFHHFDPEVTSDEGVSLVLCVCWCIQVLCS